MTLKPPSFGVCENNEKPYNAYENNEKPYNAYENFGSCAGGGGITVKTEPELADNRQLDVTAYANLAFRCESGNNSFPSEIRTISR